MDTPYVLSESATWHALKQLAGALRRATSERDELALANADLGQRERALNVQLEAALANAAASQEAARCAQEKLNEVDSIASALRADVSHARKEASEARKERRRAEEVAGKVLKWAAEETVKVETDRARLAEEREELQLAYRWRERNAWEKVHEAQMEVWERVDRLAFLQESVQRKLLGRGLAPLWDEAEEELEHMRQSLLSLREPLQAHGTLQAHIEADEDVSEDEYPTVCGETEPEQCIKDKDAAELAAVSTRHTTPEAEAGAQRPLFRPEGHLAEGRCSESAPVCPGQLLPSVAHKKELEPAPSARLGILTLAKVCASPLDAVSASTWQWPQSETPSQSLRILTSSERISRDCQAGLEGETHRAEAFLAVTHSVADNKKIPNQVLHKRTRRKLSEDESPRAVCRDDAGFGSNASRECSCSPCNLLGSPEAEMIGLEYMAQSCQPSSLKKPKYSALPA